MTYRAQYQPHDAIPAMKTRVLADIQRMVDDFMATVDRIEAEEDVYVTVEHISLEIVAVKHKKIRFPNTHDGGRY
jgi:hypothetical protein